MALDLRQLVQLSSTNEDVSIEVRRLLESGVPLVRAQIDWLAAPGTGDAIVSYEVTDEVKRHLAALHALNRNAGTHKKADRHKTSPKDRLDGISDRLFAEYEAMKVSLDLSLEAVAPQLLFGRAQLGCPPASSATSSGRQA
jgi:hypothetical protein